MKWIKTTEALPQKSGEYLVACTEKGEKEPYHYACIHYSALHKQWNNYDHFDKAEEGWDDVSHWMEIPGVNDDDAG